MKKHNRKLQRTAVALCLMLLVLLSTSVTAFAASYHTTAQITVKNNISGKDNATEVFEYVLESADGAPMPENNVIQITGAGEASFSISYDKVGVYRYTVKQKAGSAANWTYDETVYNVDVYALRNEETDTLEPLVIVYAGDGTKADGLVFNNVYKAAPAPKPSPSAKPSAKPSKPATVTPSKTPTSPKTGDTENMMLYVALMAAAATGIAAVVVLRKRARD